MAQYLGQDFRLSQQQILAPQLQQSLKLLQVPAMELQAMIEKQLITNPTLEIYDPSNDDDNEDLKSFDPDVQDKESKKEHQSQTIEKEGEEFLQDFELESPDKVCERELDSLIKEDENWKEFYHSEEIPVSYTQQYESVGYTERKYDDEETYDYRMQSIAETETLRDDLREQYMSLNCSEKDKEICFDHNRRKECVDHGT
jgi:RNA polymerase sigma-54 factor